MNRTVSTKLRVPEMAPRLVARPPLMRLLDAGLHCKVTLVSAPAGYGKTTSVAMWLRTLTDRSPAPLSAESPPGIKAAWYSLDPEEDDDVSTFFTRFAAAIEEAMPGALQAVPRGLGIRNLPISHYANILAEACSELPHQVVLVLDDYHLITKPDIHTVLSRVIQHAAARLHLVIATRHDPPLRIVHLRAQHQVAEIRSANLGMTEEETSELLELRLARRPPPGLVAELQARTEGWVAGLQLVAVAIQEYEDPSTFVAGLRRNESRYVMDFLIDEVLAHEPEAVQKFLLKTALLARFNVALAAQVTGSDTGTCQQILDRLRRANLFVVALDRDSEWFRYHRQFQAMLVDRVRVVLPAAAIDAIRYGAADWLARHDLVGEALIEYVADRRWEAAADLVESDRHRLQNREEWHLLWRRISQLPDEVVARHPGLVLGQCWILQVNDRVAAIPPLLERITALLGGAAPNLDTARVDSWWGEVYALQGSWIFATTPVEERIGLVRRALQLLQAQKHGWVRGFAYIQLEFLLVGLGQRDVAYRELTAEIAATGLGAGTYLTRLLHALSQAVFLDGSLGELHQTGLRYLQLATQNEMYMATAWARFAVAWAHFQRGESLQAWEMLLPVFDRPYATHLLCMLMALDVLVPVAAELGREHQAAELIDRVHRVSMEGENMAAVDELLALAAYASLLRKDRRPALAWAEQFMQTWQTSALDRRRAPLGSMSPLICAKIVLAAGSVPQVRRAIEPLQVFVDQFQRRGVKVQAVQGTVLLACCYWRTDGPNQAIAWMQQALEIGVRRGFRRVFFEQGTDVAGILYAMVQRGIAVEAASSLLAEYAAWSASSQSSLPSRETLSAHGITPLTEREMEVLTLLARRLSNKEIASQLGISPITVRNHTSSIYGKLHAASRKQAVARAQVLGLLHVTPTATSDRNHPPSSRR